jgi:hypothetical protein
MRNPNTDVSEAMDRISEIHEHLAKCEMYRGFRPVPVALSGLVGLLAAAFQPRIVPAGDAHAFLRYWIAAACVCGAVGVSEIAFNYLAHEDLFARRRTRHVTGQVIPSLLAGAAATIALGRNADLIALLPGIWAIVFGLGVFAARPYAPRASGWVGLYYLCAGTCLLLTASGAAPLSGWRVGIVFGVGQAAVALVLYWNLERKNYDIE